MRAYQYPRRCTLCPEKANALNGSWCRRHNTLLEYRTVSPCEETENKNRQYI